MSARQGADEITSLFCLWRLVADTGCDTLVIFCDGTCAQAWNKTFMTFCCALCDPFGPLVGHIRILKRIIMVRNPVGHTFMLCDSEFQRVKGETIRRLELSSIFECVAITREEVGMEGFVVSKDDFHAWGDYLSQFYDGNRRPYFATPEGPYTTGESWVRSSHHVEFGRSPDENGVMVDHWGEIWARKCDENSLYTFNDAHKEKIKRIPVSLLLTPLGEGKTGGHAIPPTPTRPLSDFKKKPPVVSKENLDAARKRAEHHSAFGDSTFLQQLYPSAEERAAASPDVDVEGRTMFVQRSMPSSGGR